MSLGIVLSLVVCAGVGFALGSALPHPHGGSRLSRSVEAGTAALLFGGAFAVGSHRLDTEAVDAGVPVVAVVGVLLYLGMLFLHRSLARRRRPLNPS